MALAAHEEFKMEEEVGEIQERKWQSKLA